MATPMLDLEGKVCPNHPERSAVARCFACFRPVCDECVVKDKENAFCSKKCAEAHSRTDKSFKEFSEAEARQRRKRLIKRLVAFVILIVLIWLAVSYWVSNPATVELWFETIMGAIGGVKDVVVETMQGLKGD